MLGGYGFTVRFTYLTLTCDSDAEMGDTVYNCLLYGRR